MSDLTTEKYALSYDNGFSLVVRSGAQLPEPIQIDCILDEHKNKTFQLRNHVVMESGSAAQLLINYYSISGKAYNCNDVTEVYLNESASLDLVHLNKLNNSTRLDAETTVEQAAASRMKTHFITISGGKVFNNMKVNLTGTKSEHTVSGLSLTQQNEHVDNNIQMIHASPDCLTNQLFKQILSDTSTGSFTGRIVVNKSSQKTVAYQRSANILLNPKAKMKIRPQLEIYADDVKCSHGATVGQLDAEALFYLRSRGIGDNEAKKLLLMAYANEVINIISNEEIRNKIEAILYRNFDKLPG